MNALETQDFEIRFNPDCYANVKHAPEENIGAQRKLLAEAAEFILTHQIPAFVRDCSGQIAPIDGAHLVESLHVRGINLRYLGKVIEVIADTPRLTHISILCKVEV